MENSGRTIGIRFSALKESRQSVYMWRRLYVGIALALALAFVIVVLGLGAPRSVSASGPSGSFAPGTSESNAASVPSAVSSTGDRMLGMCRLTSDTLVCSGTPPRNPELP